MEEKNIVFTGITQATSDLDCKDGDLSISHNIINQHGSMRPISIPHSDFTMQSGETLLYIHSTSNYKNFIYIAGNNLGAFYFENGERRNYSFSHEMNEGENILRIESIGNTLVLLTSKGMLYVLFKENDYKFLGDSIPEVNINFGLDSYPVMYSEKEGKYLKIFFKERNKADIFKVFSDEDKVQISDQVLPKVNYMINEYGTKKGRFMYPFFVRYALRMYDGSLIHHSSPVLMIPAAGINPIAVVNQFRGEKGTEEIGVADIEILANTCELNYKIMNDNLADILEWKDIIKSVDIFASEQIWGYDQNGKCLMFYEKHHDFSSCFCKLPQSWGTNDLVHRYYQEWDMLDIYKIRVRWNNGQEMVSLLELPAVDKRERDSKIKDCSNFYFISSLNIEVLQNDNSLNISLSEDAISNLVLKERMTDDYHSHNKLIPKYSFVYNSRLNIANIDMELFRGMNSSTLESRVNGKVFYYEENDVSDMSNSALKKCWCIVFIKQDGKDVVVENVCDMTFASFGKYLYYPNPNAYRMIVRKETMAGSPMTYDLKLQQHNGLNGAYCYNHDFGDTNDVQYTLSSNRIVNIPNKLYTSEVGNPFLFLLDGINTIGTGRILGISSTTRALSQGQFGQFPLLVFATDGIWAMEVSQNGLYSAKQPMSRDVCSNPDSITQIDGSVIFISEKGVMVVDGGEVNLLSAELDGPIFDKFSVDKYYTILTKENLTEIANIIPVKDFFSECKIAYDYPNARLIFFRKDKFYAYVYSLYSKTWATMTSSFQLSVADYPNTYLQTAGNSVINISKKIDYDSKQGLTKTLILSRPLKLGDDAYKTVNRVINRGSMIKERGAIVVFASYDGLRYVPIGSVIGNHLSGLQGSPYRYFRIAIVGNMSPTESLSMSSIYYTPKWRNRPR